HHSIPNAKAPGLDTKFQEARAKELGPWNFSGIWMLEFEVSFRQLRDANRTFITRADGQTFDAKARRLSRAGNRLTTQEGMNASRRLFAFRHRIDYFAAAVGAIASREYVGNICLPC